MNKSENFKALLLVSSQCPHCHTMEKLLRERLKKGLLTELDVINVEQFPHMAKQYGVRSVPFLQFNDFIFNEALTPAELDQWIDYMKEGSGQSHYIRYLLEHGQLNKAIEWMEKGKARLRDVIPFLANPNAKMNVRVGIGAILEYFENTQEIRAVMPDFIALLQNSDATIRTDVCYYLSLTHSIDAIEPLKKMLGDTDPEVRQVAKESIEALE